MDLESTSLFAGDRLHRSGVIPDDRGRVERGTKRSDGDTITLLGFGFGIGLWDGRFQVIAARRFRYPKLAAIIRRKTSRVPLKNVVILLIGGDCHHVDALNGIAEIVQHATGKDRLWREFDSESP